MSAPRTSEELELARQVERALEARSHYVVRIKPTRQGGPVQSGRACSLGVDYQTYRLARHTGWVGTGPCCESCLGWVKRWTR